jgi:hypothetical protein
MATLRIAAFNLLRLVSFQSISSGMQTVTHDIEILRRRRGDMHSYIQFETSTWPWSLTLCYMDQ